MIRTEQEYQRALASLEGGAEAMETQRARFREMGFTGDELDRVMQPTESFRLGVEEEVEAYERMRRGELEVLHNLTSIGRWLIGLRIARGMTQRELAVRLGVSEAQVSRDERHEYFGIGVDRAQRILDALGARFRMEMEEVASTSDGHSAVA